MRTAVLRQIDFRKDGIFGQMMTEELNEICKTLEHGYVSERGEIVSKIKPGVYTCKLEWSERFKMDLYELKAVPGHDEIKIHAANIDDQLEGCIAPGMNYGEWNDGSRCVTQSKKALKKFMESMGGDKEIRLVVESMNSGGTKKARDFDKQLYNSQKLVTKAKLLHDAFCNSVHQVWNRVLLCFWVAPSERVSKLMHDQARESH